MKKNFIILCALLFIAVFAQPGLRIVTGKRKAITAKPAGAVLPIVAQQEPAIVSAHVMAYALPYADNLDSFILRMKKRDGINVIWLFNDYYDASKMLPFLAAARRQDVKIIVGNAANADYPDGKQNNFRDMLAETWDSAAIFRWHGKRVYESYNYRGQFHNLKNMLLRPGITRDSFALWVTPSYPEFNTGNWYTYLNGYFSGYPRQAGARSVSYLLDTLDHLDGIINFPVGIQNDNGPLGNLRRGNLVIAAGAIAVGKVGVAGINHSYSSADYTSYGFANTLAQITDLLALPINERPHGICWITANDYAERSYATELIRPSENGLMYMIPLTSAADIGFQLPYPVLDNSGIGRFCLPWVLKFKNKDNTPVQIQQERIFCWYALHPKDAPFLDSMPPFLRGTLSPVLYPGSNAQLSRADWWKRTMYHGPIAGTGDSNLNEHRRIIGIKKYQDATTYYKIQMAAHLAKPGYLRIIIGRHTYTSGLQSGSAAFYDIPQEMGTPIFQILNVDFSVRQTRTGPQPITNSCWPGGWQLLIMELTSSFYHHQIIQLNNGWMTSGQQLQTRIAA